MRPAREPRVVPVSVHAEFEQLLGQYRAALELVDGVALTREQSDADLISIAARVYMREQIEKCVGMTYENEPSVIAREQMLATTTINVMVGQSREQVAEYCRKRFAERGGE